MNSIKYLIWQRAKNFTEGYVILRQNSFCFALLCLADENVIPSSSDLDMLNYFIREAIVVKKCFHSLNTDYASAEMHSNNSMYYEAFPPYVQPVQKLCHCIRKFNAIKSLMNNKKWLHT